MWFRFETNREHHGRAGKKRARKSVGRPHRFQPGIESLETRLALAAAPVGDEIAVVTTAPTKDQYNAATATAPNGDFVVVWEHYFSATDVDVYARPYFANGTPKTLLDIKVAGATAVEHQPRAAMASNGDFVVVWEQSGSPDRVNYRRYAADGTARDANPVAVDSTQTQDQANPDVAMYDNGDFVVAWEYYATSTDTDIRERAFSANGTPKYSSKSVAVTTDYEHNPRIAAQAGKGFAVAWVRHEGSVDDVYARSFNESGTAVSAVGKISPSLSGNAENPAVDMNAQGDFVVAWTQVASASGNTFVRRFTFNGSEIGSRLDVENSSLIDTRRAAVGLDDGDGVAVAYEKKGGAGGGDVLYKIYNASNLVEASGDVRSGISTDASYQRSPALAMTGAGRFVVAYHQSPNGNPDVYVRRFRQDTPPVAFDDAYVLGGGASVTLAASYNPVTNDVDADGDPLTAHIVTQPTRGTLHVNSNGSYTYEKGPNFKYFDRLTYRADDADAAGGTATVTLLTYEASQVYKLYMQVLHRAPEDGGLEYWTGRIMAGGKYSDIAQGIFESDERLNPIIAQYYQDYLLRTPDASGLAYWRDKVWKRDGGPENVVAGMISSAEFYQSAGGTNVGWTTALYQRLLGRTPDEGGLNYWVSNLDQHKMTQQQVVLGFVRSNENFKNLIAGWHAQYLSRAPSAQELDDYVAQMRAGASHRQIQLSLIDSDEYRNTPPAPAAGTAVRLSV